MNSKAANSCGPAKWAPPDAPMPALGYQMLDCFVTSTCVAQTPYIQKKKEEPMINMENDQRNYIERRIYDVMEEKEISMSRHFKLLDDESPKTAEETIQRIKDGNFVLREKNSFWGNSFNDRVQWRNPAAVKDQDGFDAAEKRMFEAKKTLMDKARLYPIAEATKAFEEFKTADFTVG